ncbi:MAG TPA: ribulose-phosphate 3-epimerase [Clostridia bacterium]|nr:ribulose-phosphate 3-epimerase [Clostridia bacterium]
MVKLAPSILSADFSCLKSEMEKVERCGVEMLHLDVMDGHFVPNITFGPGVVRALRPHSNMVFDVHLMIERPEQYIKDFAQAGADYLTVHAEATYHLHRVLAQIREQGVKPAVAINPATPLSAIEWVLPMVDMVLIMSVNPGFGGQKFIPEVIPKIRALKAVLEEKKLKIPIQVDGGIGPETAPLVVQAGAEILVAGSAVFGQPDVGQAIERILASLP